VECTEKRLLEILEHNTNSAIGRRYDFGAISSPEQYSEDVPLHDVIDMKTWLEMTYENPSGCITTSEPVVWYQLSSGTTGIPKKIPLSPCGMKQTKIGSMYGWLAFMKAREGNEKVVDGDMIIYGAPAVIDTLNGVPVGYASGIYGEHQNPIFARLIKPGPEIFNMTNEDEKMWEYAKLITTLKTTAIQGIATLALALIRRLQGEYGSRLLEEYKGTKHEARIRSALNDDGSLDLETLCPHLKLFGSSGIDIQPYRKWLHRQAPNMMVWEFYGMSETGMLGTNVYEGSGINLFGNLNYLEFIPEQEVDKNVPRVVPLAEVKKNSRYELVVTSINGWYRYRTGDLLTIEETDPITVKAIARKGRVVNLSGEKLSEAHVQNAIHAASMKTGIDIMDFTMVGEMDELLGLPNYTLAVMTNTNADLREFLVAFEDDIKANNNEYKIVRESKALGDTRIRRMKQSYAEFMLAETGKPQTKPIPLTEDKKALALCES
jgi:hypothetical protein